MLRYVVAFIALGASPAAAVPTHDEQVVLPSAEDPPPQHDDKDVATTEKKPLPLDVEQQFHMHVPHHHHLHVPHRHHLHVPHNHGVDTAFGKKSQGKFCSYHGDCESDNCFRGKCAKEDDCKEYGTGKKCDGHSCKFNGDCKSAYCSPVTNRDGSKDWLLAKCDGNLPTTQFCPYYGCHMSPCDNNDDCLMRGSKCRVVKDSMNPNPTGRFKNQDHLWTFQTSYKYCSGLDDIKGGKMWNGCVPRGKSAGPVSLVKRPPGGICPRTNRVKCAYGSECDMDCNSGCAKSSSDSDPIHQKGKKGYYPKNEHKSGYCNEAIDKSDKGMSYRGCQTKTKAGTTCQAWDSQSPHKHRFTQKKEPNAGLDGNYCRNPDGDATIWCYTTDPKDRWEYCKPLS